MTIGLLFWILMILWFVIGVYTSSARGDSWPSLGTSILPWVCVGLVGWHVFGPLVN